MSASIRRLSTAQLDFAKRLDELLAVYRQGSGLPDDLELPLEFFLRAATKRQILARMLRNLKEVHRAAEVRGEAGNTVLVRVAIDKNDVPAADRRQGAGATAQVYCGRAAIGYVWFHDLVSFVQQKILFRFF